MPFLLLVLLGAVPLFALNGEIKGTVTMAPLHSESDNELDIPCAAPAVMTNSSFPNWIKIWRLNQSETFDVSRVTFINDNQTLRIKSPDAIDSGFYECCLHAYAYEDFLCFLTQLTVSSNLSTSSNSTSTEKTVTDLPAWNVDLIDGDTLNAQEGNAYFVRIFDTNVTGIKCSKDGNETSLVKTSNAFPSELFSDILIPSFNVTLYTGLYTCNGTMKSGNETEIVQVSFDVIPSMDSNLHAQIVDPALAKKFRNSSSACASVVAIFAIAFTMWL